VRRFSGGVDAQQLLGLEQQRASLFTEQFHADVASFPGGIFQRI
jgi:hypothetical protein